MNDDRLMSSEKAGSEASGGEGQEAIQFNSVESQKAKQWVAWGNL